MDSMVKHVGTDTSVDTQGFIKPLDGVFFFVLFLNTLDPDKKDFKRL